MANLSHLPAQWRQSGLTQRAFCEREHLKLATFAYWVRKERDAPELTPSILLPASPATSHFTEVRLAPSVGSFAAAPPAPTIEIRYPDGTLVRIALPSLAA